MPQPAMMRTIPWHQHIPQIQNKFASYLPLAGGTRTGVINRNGALVQNTVSGGSVSLIASHTGATEKGAALYLWDEANSTYPGYFILRAGHTSGYSDLRGTAPGGADMEGCISDRRMLKNNERLYKTTERNYYPVGKYVIHSFKCICNFPCRLQLLQLSYHTAHRMESV